MKTHPLPLLLALATWLATSLTPISAYAAAGMFVATGNLVEGRGTHTAVRLADGRVLVTGGTQQRAWLASAETYDPGTGTWRLSGAMSVPRLYHTANLLPDGRVLVAGGIGGPPLELASTEIWDPMTGAFTAGPPMSVPRFVHRAVGLPDGRILVAGGSSVSDGAPALASAEIYDPTTGTWSATGSMVTSRINFAAALMLDGRVLIAGGARDFNHRRPSLAHCEIYNPATGTFTPAAPMSKPRGYGGAVLLVDGRVLVAGGKDALTALYDAEIYDPIANTWTLVAGNLTAGGGDGSLTRLGDGRVLAAGGYDLALNNFKADADLFDPVTGTFSPLAPMPDARYMHTATLLLDGSVLIAGGHDGARSPYELSSAARFVPNNQPDSTPPVITCPANVEILLPLGQLSAVVNYPAPVATDDSGTATVTTSPASGSVFPLGVTTVTVTATDPSGNQATCTFSVTLLSPQNTAALLDATVEQLAALGTLSAGNANSLTSKLVNAIASMNASNATAAAGQLQGFINNVNALVKSGRLSAATGAGLIDAAQQIKALLGP